MLKLFNKVIKSIERKHVKAIKANRTNEVAAAYVARLTRGIELPKVQVLNHWDVKANRWAK